MNLYRSMPVNNPSYCHLEFMSKDKKTNPIFCLANLPESTKVNTYYYLYGHGELMNLEFRLNEYNDEFVLSKRPYSFQKSKSAFNGSILSISKNDKAYTFDSLSGSNFFWVGKINSDNIPDVIISHNVEAGSEYRLYLSLPETILNYQIISKFRTGGI